MPEYQGTYVCPAVREGCSWISKSYGAAKLERSLEMGLVIENPVIPVNHICM